MDAYYQSGFRDQSSQRQVYRTPASLCVMELHIYLYSTVHWCLLPSLTGAGSTASTGCGAAGLEWEPELELKGWRHIDG